VTLLDASLFAGTVGRNKELLQRFNLMGAALVDLAITHEMGHGICQEKDERRADDYGRELRNGKIPDCRKTPGEADQRSDQPAGVGSRRPATIRRSSRRLGPAFERVGRDRATWSRCLDPLVEAGPCGG
jgi:hypothetical protein